MNIIYLHGLSSSGQSNTAKKLRELFPDDNVVTPDIPISPIERLQLLLSLAGTYKTDDTIIVGTSMGAMYASQMKGYRRILVNPAFHVSELLKENTGKKLRFFSKRGDGRESFDVTETLICEFEEMEANLASIEELYPETVIGLFGASDNVCDCRDEFLRRYHYWVEFDGGHRLNNDIIEKILIPIIGWMQDPINLRNRYVIPFKNVKGGENGVVVETEQIKVPFIIYKKGVGRKWYEEIVREYQGTKHYDGRELDMHFPDLPEGANEDTVELVYGNRYCQTPSIEIYGKNGVQVTDGAFNINNILIHIN